MTKNINSVIHLKNKISIFDYLRLFIIFSISSITLKSTVVIELPRDIQYPYLFYDRGRGTNFVNFAEKLRRFFQLNIYWTNSTPDTFMKNITAHLTISWDFIPKNINLLINLKIIRERRKKIIKLLKSQLRRVNFI